MENDIEFVCKRCGVSGVKSPLYKDEMCDSCNNDLRNEVLRTELDNISPHIESKRLIYALNIYIDDYEMPIIEKDYALIKIDESIKKSLNKLLELVELDIRQDVIDNSEYLFATNVDLDFDRIECHLHNKFSQESCEYSRSIILGFDTIYGDWTFRHKPAENTLRITTEGIGEISELRSYIGSSSILDGVDAQFILTRLEELNGDYLFRGTNRYYFHNDGIATSIYRNNSDLVEHGKLQNHESEVVSKLLSKNFYRPEGNSKISALTDLRHHGQDTCLLDFSEDYRVALFFSCQRPGGNSATIGEVIILDKSEYQQKDDVIYPNEEDFLIRPTKTEITRNRVEAQKSIFLYCHQGYIARDKNGGKVGNLLIAPRLKSALFEINGHTDETVYPDFYSFIEKPENFMTNAKQFCQEKEEGEKEYITPDMGRR